MGPNRSLFNVLLPDTIFRSPLSMGTYFQKSTKHFLSTFPSNSRNIKLSANSCDICASRTMHPHMHSDIQRCTSRIGIILQKKATDLFLVKVTKKKSSSELWLFQSTVVELKLGSVMLTKQYKQKSFEEEEMKVGVRGRLLMCSEYSTLKWSSVSFSSCKPEIEFLTAFTGCLQGSYGVL